MLDPSSLWLYKIQKEEKNGWYGRALRSRWLDTMFELIPNEFLPMIFPMSILPAAQNEEEFGIIEFIFDLRTWNSKFEASVARWKEADNKDGFDRIKIKTVEGLKQFIFLIFYHLLLLPPLYCYTIFAAILTLIAEPILYFIAKPYKEILSSVMVELKGDNPLQTKPPNTSALIQFFTPCDLKDLAEINVNIRNDNIVFTKDQTEITINFSDLNREKIHAMHKLGMLNIEEENESIAKISGENIAIEFNA